MVWESVLYVNSTSRNYTFEGNLYRYRLLNETGTTVNVSIGSSIIQVRNQSTSDIALTIGMHNIQTDTVGIGVSLQRELLNTAPTQPGAFTQPTGELEIGDTRTISWGASTDAEGDGFWYSLERSFPNGTFSSIGEWTTQTSYSYTVEPSSVIGTSVKFRVRAIAFGANGLQSPYRESPTYTVTKPKYYWSKYNVVDSWGIPPAIKTGTNENSFFTHSAKTAVWNSTLKRFVLGESTWASGEIVPMNAEAWLVYSDDTIRLNATESGKPSNSVLADTYRYTYSNSVLSFQRGTLIQSGLIAEEGTYPTDGKHTDGFWYVRGSRVNQSIAPTGAFTAPTPATVLKPSQGVAVTFTASTAPNISLYELEYRYNSGLWTTLGTNNTALTRSFTPTTDKTLTNVQFRVRAKNTSNVYSDYVYSEFFNIEHNAKPTITLTTADNPVLTENTNIVIAGEAKDTDNGNVLSVKYQINSGNTLAIATSISNGTAPLAYTKTLQFRRGTLYDGETSVIDNLIAGQTYTLKVWAEDDQGGKSEVQTRSFTVVPNRAPILTVNAVTTQSNKINNDTMTITGSVSDPENQNILVKYKINNGSLTQIYSGTGGNFTFNVKLGDTNDGENIIEIQATDTYDLLTTKKLKFTKTKNKVSLLKSSARYKATIPATGITGVVSWFERENGDLTITPDISMRNTGETEVFAAMTKTNTAPVNADVTEDQYQLTAGAAKTAVVLRVTLTKAATASDKGVKKITGALQ